MGSLSLNGEVMMVIATWRCKLKSAQGLCVQGLPPGRSARIEVIDRHYRDFFW